MLKLSDLVTRLLRDRRRKDIPVATERRHRMTLKEADRRRDEALDRLNKIIEKHTKIERVEVANDIQQVTIFSTFQDICDKLVKQGEFRLCRHADHPAANTGIAKCTEELCPFMRGKMAMKEVA